MRALRGLATAALSAVLAIGSGSVATATQDDGAPTAAVVPGHVTSWVNPEPTTSLLSARWTREVGRAIEVPRGTASVELVLPDDAVHLVPGADASVSPTVFTAWGSQLQLSPWVTPLESSLVIDVTALLAEVAERQFPSAAGGFRFAIRAGDWRVREVNLIVEFLLTDAPASGQMTIPLTLPDDAGRVMNYEATPVAIAPGTRVTVSAEPGFFLRTPELPPTVEVWHEINSYYTPDYSISPDGGSITFPLPDIDVSWMTRVQIGSATGTGTGLSYAVLLDLLPAGTDPVAAYVTAVYNDLFGRDPDPTGLEGWTGALMRGVPYSAVSDAITSSDEFRMGLIRGAYADYLGREPDAEGMAGWLRAMNRGLHIQQMEAGFLASQEYYETQGNGNDGTWVWALYVDVLGRPPSASENMAWVRAIVRQGREQVARSFLYSTEKLETDVDGYYQWLLRRPLDAVGRVGWVRAIQGGHRVEEIIAGIIASQEYRNNVPVG